MGNTLKRRSRAPNILVSSQDRKDIFTKMMYFYKDPTPFFFERVLILLSQCSNTDPDYEKILRQSSNEANKLGINLETALFLSNEAASELQAFVELLKHVKPPIVNWIIFHK